MIIGKVVSTNYPSGSFDCKVDQGFNILICDYRIKKTEPERKDVNPAFFSIIGKEFNNDTEKAIDYNLSIDNVPEFLIDNLCDNLCENNFNFIQHMREQPPLIISKVPSTDPSFDTEFWGITMTTLVPSAIDYMQKYGWPDGGLIDSNFPTSACGCKK